MNSKYVIDKVKESLKIKVKVERSGEISSTQNYYSQDLKIELWFKDELISEDTIDLQDLKYEE